MEHCEITLLHQSIPNLLQITAYKEVDIEDNSIESPATIILNDVNDNSPLITIDTNTIFIWESTFETLPFDQFSINDPDLGTHATYTVELTQDSTELYSTAFTIIPSSGYQVIEQVSSQY